MLLGTTYPLLEVFWTMLIFFAFIVWIWILFAVIGDIFRRKDIGGWGKVGWIVLIVVLPYLGVFVYLIAQHEGMQARSMERAQAAQSEMADYVRNVAGPPSTADQIAKAKALLDQGAIDQQEFDQLKLRALSA